MAFLHTGRYWNSWNSVLMITWFNCNWLQLTAINCNQLQCHCKPLQLIAIDCNETQYGEKATYFQHSPLNSRTLVNHEPTMITASPNIHQTAAVVSNWQALLVLFEIERKKSVKTQRETKLSPASWLERKVASKLCGRGQICFVKGGRKRSLRCRRWRSSMCIGTLRVIRLHDA